MPLLPSSHQSNHRVPIQLHRFSTAANPQHTSQTSTSQTTIDSDKAEQLKKLDAEVQKNGPEVVDKIVSRVLKVNPELHPNLKKIEA